MITDAVGEQILADVIAHPDDDGLRLVYADWCEDAGQAERAEFIRTQCELARPCDGTRPSVVLRRDALRRREGELWYPPARGLPPVALPPDWALTISSLQDDAEGPQAVVRRGFVEEAGCPLQVWLDHGPALVRTHPLRRVTLTDRRPSLRGNADPTHKDLGRWVWSKEGTTLPFDGSPSPTNSSWVLPLCLWVALEAPLMGTWQKWFLEEEGGGPDGCTVPPGTTAYRAAINALSAACLLWAWREAQRRDLAAALSVTGGAVV